MERLYRTATDIQGPLVLVEVSENVKYQELVEIEVSGELRHGNVLEVNGNKILVQLFEGGSGLNLSTARFRFVGHGMQFGLAPEILGRIFNGQGIPIDNAPAVIPNENRDVNGSPINPSARDYPSEFIQTGISAIDGLNTLVRGQKLPIFLVQVCLIMNWLHKLRGRQKFLANKKSLQLFLLQWELHLKKPSFL